MVFPPKCYAILITMPKPGKQQSYPLHADLSVAQDKHSAQPLCHCLLTTENFEKTSFVIIKQPS